MDSFISVDIVISQVSIMNACLSGAICKDTPDKTGVMWVVINPVAFQKYPVGGAYSGALARKKPTAWAITRGLVCQAGEVAYSHC